MTDNLNLGASSGIICRANELRENRTKSELIMWEQLRANKLGVKFRQQHPLLHYVLDFYCFELRLAIELDWPIHNQLHVIEHDHRRTIEIEENNIKLVRFKNEDLYYRLEKTISKVKEIITQRKKELSSNSTL